MSTFRYTPDIVLFWGNMDAKFAPEEVLYESNSTLIVNFKLSMKDPLFQWIQRCEKYVPNLQGIIFHYVHKKSGIYNYSGPIERLKITGIYSGMAHMEIVILKQGEDDSRRPTFVYPCSTKNDVCRLLKAPLLASNELVNKISKTTNN
jgi:hypothetical protein